MKINLIHHVSGVDRPGKERSAARTEGMESLNVSVGDTLEFELDNGTIKTMQVAGIVQDPSTGAGDFLSQPFAYITTSTLSYLHQPERSTGFTSR